MIVFSFFIPTVCPTVDQKLESVTQDNCILVMVIAAIMSVVSAALLVAVISLSVTVFFLLAKNKRMATHASPTYRQLEPTAQQPEAEYEVIPEGVSHHIVTGMKPNESYGKLQVWDANQIVPPETGGERTHESVEVGN